MLKNLLKQKPAAASSAAAPGAPSGGTSGSPVASSHTHIHPLGAGGTAGMASHMTRSPAAGPPTDYDSTPRADLPLPHAPRRDRRRSSVVREERASVATAAAALALLKDTPPAKREALFKQKLQLCSVEFNWDDPESDKKAKEAKRVTLLELVDHVNSPGGQKLFTEALTGDVTAMVAANVFRSLPPPPPSTSGGEEVTGVAGGEDGEEEPFLEPAWPHLQLVYEFLLRFIVSGEVKAKAAKKYIDTAFCAKLIEMFDSEDPRERDYLKTILHRIYGKFMSHRSFIRKAISNVFYRFVYETEKHNGVGELLEILGSIINGFALPLKPEHITFLEKALIPLHRPRGINAYFQQLCYCITQYIEKDPTTVVPIVRGLLRSWPSASSAKQIVFLNELEEVMELAGPEAVMPIVKPLFRTLGKCVGSSHFQVAERALFLWNNEHLLNHGILAKTYAAEVLPLIFSGLMKNGTGHWNTTVETLAQNVLKHYQEADAALYERCEAASAAEPREREAALQARRARWAGVEAQAASMVARGGARPAAARPAGYANPGLGRPGANGY